MADKDDGYPGENVVAIAGVASMVIGVLAVIALIWGGGPIAIKIGLTAFCVLVVAVVIHFSAKINPL